jgi:hypothetical protein
MIACITDHSSRGCSATGATLMQCCSPFHAKYRDFAEILFLETNQAEDLIIFLLLISYLLVQVACVFFPRLCDYFLSSLQQNMWVTEAANGTPTDVSFTS